MNQLIQDLDLSRIKAKLQHHSGENWSAEQCEVAEMEYKKFLHLCLKYKDKTIGLTKEADIFWHYHILNTKQYQNDCQKIFGHFMHHDPDMIEEDMEIHKEALVNFNQLYKAEFQDLGPKPKSDNIAYSARVTKDMSYSARAVAYSARVAQKDMAYSARAVAYSARVAQKDMAYSARAVAYSARVAQKDMSYSARAVAYSARVAQKDMAYSARAVAYSARNMPQIEQAA